MEKNYDNPLFIYAKKTSWAHISLVSIFAKLKTLQDVGTLKYIRAFLNSFDISNANMNNLSV